VERAPFDVRRRCRYFAERSTYQLQVKLAKIRRPGLAPPVGVLKYISRFLTELSSKPKRLFHPSF
jgi:hypothetical protein